METRRNLKTTDPTKTLIITAQLMANHAEACGRSAETSTNNTPSPHLGPALPPVRMPVLAPLNDEGPSEVAHTKLAAVSALLQGPDGLPEQALPAQLVQQQLLHHLKELHQKSMQLQIEKVLCAAALTSSAAHTLSGPGADANPQQAPLLQQLAMLTPEQQLALHFGLGAARPAYAGVGPAGSAWQGPELAGARTDDQARPKEGGRRRNFHGKQAVACLSDWLHANMKNPYPSLEIKRALARTSGLTEAQVDHWFNNARKRRIKGGGKPKKENLNPSAAVQIEHRDQAKCAAAGSPKVQAGENPSAEHKNTALACCAALLTLRVE